MLLLLGDVHILLTQSCFGNLMVIHKIVFLICLYNLNENMCKNIFQQYWNKEKYYWHFSSTNIIKFMHFGRIVLFKQTTNWKDFSHIYLPCSYLVHQATSLLSYKCCLKEESKLYSSPGCCEFSHPFFALLQKGTLNASLDKNHCRLNLLKSWLWFSFQV